jgi:hypothetical protein
LFIAVHPWGLIPGMQAQLMDATGLPLLSIPAIINNDVFMAPASSKV